MGGLREYADGIEDILHPYGDLDLLLYYGLIAEKLQPFLHGRELATRTWLPKGRIPVVVKRGSLNPPFFIEQLARAVTPAMMEARKKFRNLAAARHVLSPDQALAWFYFVPRKYAGFHYATNREGEGREITRVVYDVDRGKNVSAEDAIEVASLLVTAALEDETIAGLIRDNPLASWTGSSFHVALTLKSSQPAAFYGAQIEYTGKGRTITDRLIDRVSKASRVSVSGGHVRRPGHITVDPSLTPSGHLCRVPLGSLHMDSATVIGGVSVPLGPDMLYRGNVSDLQAYTPRRIIEELDGLARRLSG